MTAREFVSWRHIMHNVPLDHERTAWGLAIQSCLLANINRDRKKTREFEVSDFLVRDDLQPAPRKQQTPEEMMTVLSALVALNNNGRNRQD